jgi:hypothetical protein
MSNAAEATRTHHRLHGAAATALVAMSLTGGDNLTGNAVAAPGWVLER